MKEIFKKINKNPHFYILGLIFLLALIIRIWFTSGNNIYFQFDQARDAVISTSIIENHDLKIQGPSASGTNDSVFHGVLYYYLIAPIYYFGGGSPQILAYALALFSSLSVIVTYYLARDILGKEKVALLAAFLVAISAVGVQEGIWLSNPVIMVLSIPLFFWMIWKVFFLGKKKYIYWLLFFLGITNQAAIFTVFLLGPLVIAYFYKVKEEKRFFIFSLKEYFLGTSVYLLTVSAMILTEVLMLKRGILTFDILNKTSEHLIKGYEALVKIIPFYSEFFLRILSPTNLLLLFLPLFILIWWRFSKLNTKKRLYFLMVIFSPLWMLTWHFRTSLHLFIGLNVFVCILLADGFWELKKMFRTRMLFVLMMAGFMILNLGVLRTARDKRAHFLGIQKGALLAEQIELIQKTYELVGNEEFSISTITAPYGVNVTWSYLYNQHGSREGLLPKFFGPSQEGWVGAGLLEEIDYTLENHFTIVDPDTLLNDSIFAQFLLDQTAFSSEPVATYKFGTLTLEHRKTKIDQE